VRRRRERRSSELTRLDAMTPEQRAAEVARIIAEVDEPEPAPADVEAAVARVLDQRELARTEAAAAAAYDKGRAPDRRPCARCGIESSTRVKPDGSEQPLWHPDGGRYHCGACHSELSFDRLGLTDADRKVAVALRLLGLDKSIPMAAAGSSHSFAGLRLWHHECSDAPPAQHPDGRWQHVDRVQLRSDFDAIVGAYHGHTDGTPSLPPPLGPCPACGVEASYRTAQGIIRCGGCSWERQYVDQGVIYPTSLPSSSTRGSRPGERSPRDRDAAELLGLPLVLPMMGPDPLLGLAEQVGFAYWVEMGWQEPNEKPWAHLDLKRMRRRAKVSV
jgi:hypothetical protein